jgi:hypothetical protein
MFTGPVIWRGLVYTALMTLGKLFCGLWLLRVPNPFTKLQWLAHLVRGRVSVMRKAGPAQTNLTAKSKEKPLSLYPSLILGSAMVSRGEIGYLISSLAESYGVFSRGASERTGTSEPSEIFLVVTWAITLCTIAGPVTMGCLVSRVRKLEAKASKDDAQDTRANVLGSWGIS